MRPDQGTVVECVYCKFVEPALQGTKDCPACRGSNQWFVPARMMDQETSRSEIMRHITGTSWDPNPDTLREQLLHLLHLVDLYGFDLKQGLIEALRELSGVHSQ